MTTVPLDAPAFCGSPAFCDAAGALVFLLVTGNRQDDAFEVTAKLVPVAAAGLLGLDEHRSADFSFLATWEWLAG